MSSEPCWLLSTQSKALWVGVILLGITLFFLYLVQLVFFPLFVANASKVYAYAVAKSQKIWSAYLEAIMKVAVHVAVMFGITRKNMPYCYQRSVKDTTTYK